MRRTLTNILLTGSIILGATGMYSCSNQNSDSTEKKEPVQVEQKSDKKYEFTKFGEVDQLELGLGFSDINQVSAADIDKDGDLDIIVGTEDGRIIIYENKVYK